MHICVMPFNNVCGSLRLIKRHSLSTNSIIFHRFQSTTLKSRLIVSCLKDNWKRETVLAEYEYEMLMMVSATDEFYIPSHSLETQ